MTEIKNNGYQIWPVYYGHEFKYRVVKFISNEIAYERQFFKKEEAVQYVIDVEKREREEANEAIIQDIFHPTEHDESDDLEDAKRTVSEQMQMDLEPLPEADVSGVPPISKDDAERGSW
jgi:hypothetical protein